MGDARRSNSRSKGGIRRSRIAEVALRSRLPTISGETGYAQADGLTDYGFVDRILTGCEAGRPPIEQPTKFELVINLKTAKALGLAIPPPLLLRADQVIG